ncbi:MAG: S8 family serine peptidase, partial [Coriobacteriales bacterium]
SGSTSSEDVASGTNSADTSSSASSTADSGEGISTESISNPLTTTVDDPYALISDYSSTRNQWWLYAVNAFDAWDYQKCEGSVTVAVIDTGIRFDHEDLADNIDTEHAYDAVSESQMTQASSNRTSALWEHGTHVAGIISGVANNGTGIAGISYNAKILPINVFELEDGELGASTETIINAYDYLKNLIDTGELTDLHVINMSLGGYTEDEYDQLLDESISELKDMGVMTVCSGGNGDDDGNPITDTMIPGDYEDCVSVTASTYDSSTNEYVISTWSDRNDYKDICAPGQSITSTLVTSTNAYGKLTGTSMAAPIVSGSAALLFAKDPGLSVDDVEQLLYNNATDIGDTGWDESSGWGVVNPEKALESMRNATITADSESVNVSETTTLEASVCTQDESDPALGTDWQWSVDDTSIATISDDGKLTGLAEGSVVVTVTSTADPTLTGKKRFLVEPLEISTDISALASSSSIDVSWDNTPGAVRFDVYRSTEGADGEDWTKVAEVSSDEIGSDGTYTWSDTDVEVGNAYYYKVVPVGELNGAEYVGTESNVAGEVYKGSVLRLSGSDRYGTLSQIVGLFATEIAAAQYGGGIVIVASGENYADALAASGLAGIENSPIILVKKNSVPDDSAQLLEKLNPSFVYIIGGAGAISEKTKKSIEKIVPDASVTRIYGKTRIETAEEIYGYLSGLWGDTAFIADSTNFADALSACTDSFANYYPIFLANPNSSQSISSGTLQRIKQGGFTKVVVLGGTGAVPESAVTQLENNGISVERWAGANRYETSQVIAENAIEAGDLSPYQIGIATGENFADALAAGPLLGFRNSPLLLVDDSDEGLTCTQSGGVLESANGETQILLVFGGAGAVPDDVVSKVRLVLGL